MLRRTLDTVPYYNSTNKYFFLLALGKEIQVLVGLLRVGERRMKVR